MVDFVSTKTRAGDTLALLASDYGVPVADIVQANGLVMPSNMPSTYINSRAKDLGIGLADFPLATLKQIIFENDINQWVASRGGTPLTFKAGSTTAGRRLAGSPGGGFVVFNDSTEIFLPNRTRKSAIPPTTPVVAVPPVMAQAPVSGNGLLIGAGLMLGLGLVLATRKKR